MPQEFGNILSDEFVYRLRRVLEWFEGPNARRIDTIRAEPPPARIDGYFGYATTAVTSANPTGNQRTITAAAWSANLVTITTSAAHGYQIGEIVTITGMTPSGYNGTYTVVSVPTLTTFTYALTSNPGTATVFGHSQTMLLGTGTVEIYSLVADAAGGTDLADAGYTEDVFTFGTTAGGPIPINTELRLSREPISGKLLAFPLVVNAIDGSGNYGEFTIFTLQAGSPGSTVVIQGATLGGANIDAPIPTVTIPDAAVQGRAWNSYALTNGYTAETTTGGLLNADRQCIPGEKHVVMLSINDLDLTGSNSTIVPSGLGPGLSVNASNVTQFAPAMIYNVGITSYGLLVANTSYTTALSAATADGEFTAISLSGTEIWGSASGSRTYDTRYYQSFIKWLMPDLLGGVGEIAWSDYSPTLTAPWFALANLTGGTYPSWGAGGHVGQWASGGLYAVDASGAHLPVKFVSDVDAAEHLALLAGGLLYGNPEFHPPTAVSPDARPEQKLMRLADSGEWENAE